MPSGPEIFGSQGVQKKFKVKNYFSLNYRTPFDLESKVIYEYECLCDTNKSYIGKTVRHLTTRAKEHGKKASAILQHLDHCSTCCNSFDLDQFKILDTSHDQFDCSIKEALYIKANQPYLNTQLFNSGSSFKLNIFN